MCEKCGKCFYRKKSYSRHIRIHEMKAESENLFKCDYCPQKFLLESNKELHMSRKHPDGGPIVPTRQVASVSDSGSGTAPKKQPVVKVKAVKPPRPPKPPKPPRPPRPPYVRPPRKPRIVTQEEVDNAVKAGLKVAYSLRGNPLIYNVECEDCDRLFATKSALRQHRSVQV